MVAGAPFLELLLGLVNLGLLIALVLLFVQQWVKVRSPFTLGLLLFAVVFLLQDSLRIVVALARVTRTHFPLADVGLLLEVLQLVAVGALIYVVTR